jgi:imidazolonepropionase
VKPELLVRNCRQLVTLAGPKRPRIGPELRDLAIIRDGFMLVRDGRIKAVGPRDQIEAAAAPSAQEIDAGGRIVLPGFVDAHTHTVFAGNRADEFEDRIKGATYQEIAARGGGIRSTVRRTRAASEADLLAAARRYRNWFLRGGTTTIEAKSGYGLSLEAEMKILRVIRQLGAEPSARYVPTFLGAHEIPEEFRSKPARYVDLVIDMLPLIRDQSLAEFCDVFCEPSLFPLDQARAILSAARQFGFGLRVHADQFRDDGAAQLAAEMRAATADHLEYTSEPGLRALAEAGVQPVLLPHSVFHLGSSRYPAARRMIELGLAVVLASDFNPGSSPTCSMPLVLSLACAQMRLTPAETITAATINAACSLRLGDQIGSLEPGKRADFVIHDCEDYRELPYFAGRETARAVYIEGRPVLV